MKIDLKRGCETTMTVQSVRKPTCRCKIGRTIATYRLDDLEEDLVRRRHDGTSLRDLALYVNYRILETAIESASGSVLDDGGLFGALDRQEAIATIYEALQGDGVAPDRRARVRTRLEQDGVDLDRLEDAWVTHTTVRRHLRECEDVDTSSEPTVDSESATTTIEWARSRCTAIVDRTLERLASADDLGIASPEVSVSIRVTCTACGATFEPGQLISRGHCDCRSRGEAE